MSASAQSSKKRRKTNKCGCSDAYKAEAARILSETPEQLAKYGAQEQQRLNQEWQREMAENAQDQQRYDREQEEFYRQEILDRLDELNQPKHGTITGSVGGEPVSINY